MNKIEYKIIKQLISKDDVYGEEIMDSCESLDLASEALTKWNDSGTWQNYEHYEIHLFFNNQDHGSVELIKCLVGNTYSKQLTGFDSCEICASLKDREYGLQKYGSNYEDSFLPEAANELIDVFVFSENSDRKLILKKCPLCERYYIYRSDYEFFAYGSEDEQELTRLNEYEVYVYLKVANNV